MIRKMQAKVVTVHERLQEIQSILRVADEENKIDAESEIDEVLTKINQIKALALDGRLKLSMQEEDQAEHADVKSDCKLFTFFYGGPLKNSVLSIGADGALRKSQNLNIDLQNWYSCQIDYRTVF